MATYNAYQSQPYPYNTTGVPTYYSNWQYNPTYTQPQYQQLTQPVQNQSQPVQTPQTGINWVQGEAGAKSFTVMAGQSVMLMNRNSGYSRHDGKEDMIANLHDMLNDATSAKEKDAIHQCIEKLQNM